MDAGSSRFNLNPSSSVDRDRFLLSLKLSSQLQCLLESADTDDHNLEIEFTSLTEGRIYCGTSVFDLKYSDSSVLVSILDCSMWIKFEEPTCSQISYLKYLH